MISQCWIHHHDISLAAVSHQPVAAGKCDGAVLISGFSNSMCDSDYFMSRLARRLAGDNLYVLQVDPLGHGDSPGDLSDVTLDSLRADIECSIQYAAGQAGGRIFCVGRGLSATLMAELAGYHPLAGVAGINPYCLEMSIAKMFAAKIGTNVIDTAVLFGGNDFWYFLDFDRDWIAFFEAMGASSLFNLVGQKISGKIIAQLAAYEPSAILQRAPESKFWLTPDKNCDDGISHWVPDRSQPYLGLQNYGENRFPQDPAWLHNAIERISLWIAGKRGE